MFTRADDAADDVAHALEVETAVHFALDQLTHNGGLASLLGRCAAF
jgi:hypothetical protein